MKQFIKNSLPYPWKLQYRLLQRIFNEKKNGYLYAKNYLNEDIGNYKVDFKQNIRKGDFYENKIHNLKIVCEKINNIIIKPNEVFSFWKVVGKPSKKTISKKAEI